ncbi:hypothetical protein C2845_PM09G08720 [Panicum miliaceum]|uniref:Uncharacterized protein n=1 Tax=Panicum miliaceum TaxID=4540 RepID=A0A3L6S0S3_PANMI|nr:hypothetical protein C2845_PM09G08720 [Panicum miliaceum]
MEPGNPSGRPTKDAVPGSGWDPVRYRPRPEFPSTRPRFRSSCAAAAKPLPERAFFRATTSSMSRAGSDDAPLDLGRNVATGEKASSDAPVDLEKGATGAKDVGAVLYVFYYIGMMAWMVRHSDNWSATWPVFPVLTATLVWALWMAPKMKYDTKPARGSGDSDLKATLLPSKK